MLESDLIVQIAKQERVIDLQEKLIAVMERDEERLKSVIAAQDALIKHLQVMDSAKNTALDFLRKNLDNAEVMMFPKPRIF